MKTYSSSSAAVAAVAAQALPQAATASDAGLQSVSDFHQQRAGVLRPMARPAPPAPQNRGRQGGRPPALRTLERALVAAVACLERGGSGDLERFMEESGLDVLERHTLLREMARTLADKGARAAVETLQAQLTAEHGGAIGAGSQQQDWFAAAVQELDGEARMLPDYDAGALRRLREQFGGAAGGHGPLDALALGKSLQALGGARAYVDVLASLRRRIAADPRLRRADAGGARVWLSLREAANFNLLQSCYEVGADLHAALAGAGLLAQAVAPGHDGIARAATGLLQAGSAADAAALADLVGAVPHLAGRQAYTHIAAAARRLPLTLWPAAEARRALLAALDGVAASAAPDEGLAGRLARRLRGMQGAAA